jgi:hypothetical protein
MKAGTSEGQLGAANGAGVAFTPIWLLIFPYVLILGFALFA